MPEHGITELCVLHFRQYDEIKEDPLYDRNRHEMILPVEWDENGERYFVTEKNKEGKEKGEGLWQNL